MKCPACGKGQLIKKKIRETIYGTCLGEFPAQVCNHCNESFTDSITTKHIEEVAKQKGVWGLGKKTKITRSGNSLAVRIPKEVATYLKLHEGKEVYISADKDKLIVE